MVLALLPALPLLVLGQMYRWVDKSGESHFTDDRSTIPKGAKVVPYEPSEGDVSIGTIKEGTPVAPAPTSAPAAVSAPAPVQEASRPVNRADPAATLTLGPLPKSLKPGDAEVLLTAVQFALDSPKLKAFGGLLKTIRLDVIERSDDPRLSRTPEWAGGFAVSATQVYLLSPYIGQVGYGKPRQWSQMTLHEVAHAQQRQWSGSKQVPRWFVEGYAMYVSGEELGATSEDVAWWAIERGQGAPLSNAFRLGPQRAVLRGAERADHALMDYGLAAEGVRLMVALRNEAAVGAVLEGLHEGLEFDAAFKKAMGLEIKELEAQLLTSLKPDFHQRAQ